MRCKIAEKFGGWPHEVGEFPLHYYRYLGRFLREEAQRQNEAVEKAQNPDALDIDFEAESFKGEAV